MSSATTLVITINPLDPARAAYLIQLSLAGKPIAQATTQIDRQHLLALEHSYNAHDYGMALYDALLIGDVNREYQRLVGKAGATDTVRIQLVISEQASELHALAWERLFHIFGDEASPVAISAQTPFARFLISGAGDQAATPADPLRLLLVLANPSHLGAQLAVIDVAREVSAMAAMVAQSKGQVKGTILPGRSGLPDDIRQQLVDAGWTIAEGVSSWQNIQRHLPGQQILHIIAHGQIGPDRQQPQPRHTYLLLEHEGDANSARGALDRVDDTTISTQLSGVRPLPQLIFLAACDSARRPPAPPAAQDQANSAEPQVITANPFVGLAPKLVVDAGVPAVIAMQDRIEIGMAHTLMRDFYRRLFEHGQVDRALNEARALHFAHDSFAWAIPVLFLRLADGRLFVPPTLPARLSATIPVPPPAPPATFGRQALLDQVVADLAQMPRSALRGSAGVGKSHLALALANEPAVVNAFPAGRAWLELGPAADRFAALGNLLGQLGASAEAAKTEAERAALLRTWLAGRRLLLVLDDVWQVADAAPFLAACQPPTRVVLTTRSAQLADDLAAAQHEVPVLERPPALEMLAAAGVGSAQAIALDPAGAQRLAEELGDLPLALHVAGRHLNRLVRSEGARGALAQLVADLQTQTEAVLQLRAAAPRPGLADAQPTLEAVLDLSYRALPAPAQAALRQLATFGPQPWHFDTAAMAAVWQLASASDARELRASLIDAGLLIRLPAPDTGSQDTAPQDTGPRYALHQVVAAFAAARLAEDPGAARAAHLAHAAHYAAVVNHWDTAIANQQMGYAAPHEWENVARAVEWLAPQVEKDAEVAAALLVFTRQWRDVLLNNYDPRRTRWLALGVAAAQSTNSDWDLANTLKAQGDVYRFLQRNEEALAVYAQALTFYRTVGDRLGEANTLKAQGDVYRFLDRNEEALAVYAQALALFRTVGDRLGEANTLKAQGDLALQLDNEEQGMALYQQAHQLFVAVGDRVGPVNIGINLARYAAAQGDLAAAIGYMQPAADFGLEIGHPLGAQLQAELEQWQAELGQPGV